VSGPGLIGSPERAYGGGLAVAAAAPAWGACTVRERLELALGALAPLELTVPRAAELVLLRELMALCAEPEALCPVAAASERVALLRVRVAMQPRT
jgi:hypothetical protein